MASFTEATRALSIGGTDLALTDKSRPAVKRSIFRLPLDRINWLTSSFLIGTAVLMLTALPLYLGFSALIGFRLFYSS